MIRILDSCMIKYGIKNHTYELFKNSWILTFQKEQLSSSELKLFILKGGSILEKSYVYKGDHNFLDLNPSHYYVLTYDKALNYQLKKLGFLTKALYNKLNFS